jgi:hypothetical protein
MKKITLFAFAFFVCTIANAQFSKGEKYLSGSFSGQVNDYDLNDHAGTDSYSISFAPAFSRFVSAKKAVGLKIMAAYQYSKAYNPDITTQRSTQFGLGIFSQNYLNLNKGFYLLLEKGISGIVGLGSNDIANNPAASSDLTQYSLGIYLAPGIGYKLSDRLIIGLNLGSIISANYTHSKIKYPNYSAKNDALQVFSSLNNINLGSVGITFGWKLK